MDVGEQIRTHLNNELGSSYKDLAAAAERDNAAKASDKALFLIFIISVLVTGCLVSYRLWLHTNVRVQTLKQLNERE
uniref:Envelope protein n=1 Tax=Chionoecetes opilio bacilliform virus TaxID=1825681 RepID=A0A1Q3DLI4_9VIRU|nr:wsv293a-like protein [Chionoecetes opilio bacilliform virus]GAV93239.1 envelope protein [Chionoecetes opilio bacilliform virus]